MPDQLDSYADAVAFLYSRIDYERRAPRSRNAFGLDRIRELLRRLGDPQEAVPCVHVAGTKGKGSTSAMIAAGLSAAGCRTGLGTSPHVSRIEERFRVDGALPTEDEFTALVDTVRQPALDMDREGTGPTFFELVTALGWLHFVRRRADIAVVEVGVGGRLDSTNVCRPVVTVITNTSRDHVQLLGTSIPEIAREKAGIVKPGVPVVTGVSGEARPVVEDVAAAQGSPVWLLGRDVTLDHGPAGFTVHTPGRHWPDVELSLRGRHQAANAALALAAVDALHEHGWNLPQPAVRDGLARVEWPLRFEVVTGPPTVVLDAAHNEASTAALAETLAEEFPDRRRILLFAVSSDKDAEAMLAGLLPACHEVVYTRYVTNPRAVPPEELQRLGHALAPRPGHVVSDPAEALHTARRLAREHDVVCATGSFFLAAEVRSLLLGAAPPVPEAAAPTVV